MIKILSNVEYFQLVDMFVQSFNTFMSNFVVTNV